MLLDYQELFICVGRDYLRALSGYETLIPSSLITRISQGGLGKKLSELHDWLYGKSPEFKIVKSQHRHPRIKGIEVTLTPTQVMEIARQAIVDNPQNATNYQSWYIQIDDQRVAPKWLVSQLTGLPVSDFVTTDARRLLAQLGFEVKRV